MAINPEKNAVEQGLIARLIGKIKRIALDMGDSVAAETSRARAAEAAAKTVVAAGENCTVEKSTGADGHDVYTVNADGKPQVQADWDQADSSKVDYIKNKPNLGLKADKVQGATAGNLAALDANGNLTDSGKKTADFATALQGDKADSAVQGVKVNGTELFKDGNNVVDVPVPTASTSTPLKDGTASAGSSTQWARGDHRHPTDDSREAVANKVQSIDDSSTTEYPSSKAVADFVNSSVATNTANFLGTISESSLGLDHTATNVQIELALNVHSWESTPTNNDYCFVSVNDPQTTDVDEYRRFKYNDKTNVWGYEYTLNNSSFTQAQWDAINSGLTSSDRTAYNAAVTLLNSHVGDGSIHVTSSEKNAWNAKQDAISDLATIRSGAAAGASALQPSGNGSNLSVTPDGTSTGYDLGSSTTLKAFAQKFKNLVGALKALAFKDKVSDSDISGTISDSHISSASTWNGKYTKPSTGIPKTDLASGVQASLGKADSALQSHQDISGKANLANTSQYILSEPNQADASKYLVVSQSEFGGSSTSAWMNYDLVLVIQSRHSGSGIAVIQCNVNTGSPTENALTGTIQVYATNSSVRLSSPMKMYRKYNASTYMWTVTVVVQCSDYNEFQIKSVLSKRGNLNYSTTLSYVTDLSSLGTLIATATSLGSLAYKSTVGTSDISDDAITAAKVKDNETLPVNITGSSGSCSGNAATATKATQDSDGNNIKTNYMKASSGNKSLSYGGTTTIGTVNGSNVNLVMPAANADTYAVNANSTSFSDALAAYNANKKLVLIAGRQGTGSFVTRYEIPLYRVVLNGTTITQFVWIASDDAYNETSGSNTFGAIMYYKLSSSGWDIGSDNIDFAKVAGRTIGDVVSATANSAITWGASVQNLLLTKASGEVTVDVKNLIVGQVYWIHVGRAIKVKFKNSGASCTMYAYGTSATINNVNTFDIQDNINYSLHGSFSAAVIRSSEASFYVMMGYGDAH